MRQGHVVAERARRRTMQRDDILSSLSSGAVVNGQVDETRSIARSRSLMSPLRRSLNGLSEDPQTPLPLSPQLTPSEPLFPALCQNGPYGPSRLQLLKSGDGALGSAVGACYANEETPVPRSIKAVARRLSRALSKAVQQADVPRLNSQEPEMQPPLLEPIVAISARGPVSARCGRMQSMKGAILNYQVGLLDLPAEMMLLVLGEMIVADLCKLRPVCIGLSVLVDEIAKRVYLSIYGSLIEPFNIGTGWAPLLREAERREKIYNLWSNDVVWMVARGMDKRLQAHINEKNTWTSSAADAALVEAARNPLGGPLYEQVIQLNNHIHHRTDWAFVIAASLVGCNLALANVLVAANPDMEPDVVTLAHVASVIRQVPRLPPFMHDSPTLRSYVFAVLCTRTDEDAIRTLRWLLTWKNSFSPPPLHTLAILRDSPLLDSPCTSPLSTPLGSPVSHKLLNPSFPRATSSPAPKMSVQIFVSPQYPAYFLRYKDFKGSFVPLIELALRWKASRVAITALIDAGGRPSLGEFLSLVSTDDIVNLWWIISPPAYSWEEITSETAKQGNAGLLSYLISHVPKRLPKTKMLKMALEASNRSVAEMLMPIVRVKDRSMLGVAIHGCLYDLAYTLAARGAKLTELYKGRPLVLLLANTPFLTADARALMNFLLSPQEAHTQGWLSIALNVPHEGDLPMCAAVIGDAALYKVTRLLKAGAKPDHSDAAGNTPLLLALKNSNSEGAQQVADLLLQHGASVNARNVADESPLSVAVAQANVGLIHRLIGAGALPHVSANGGATILHLWLEMHAPDWQATRLILEALIPRLIPAEARTHDGGDTLLHYAIKFRRRHAIDVLLMLGASPDTANQSNTTPLQLAQRLHMTADVIARLKEHSQKRSTCAVA